MGRLPMCLRHVKKIIQHFTLCQFSKIAHKSHQFDLKTYRNVILRLRMRHFLVLLLAMAAALYWCPTIYTIILVLVILVPCASLRRCVKEGDGAFESSLVRRVEIAEGRISYHRTTLKSHYTSMVLGVRRAIRKARSYPQRVIASVK